MSTQKKVAAKKTAPKKTISKPKEEKSIPAQHAGLTPAQQVSDVIQHKAV